MKKTKQMMMGLFLAFVVTFAVIQPTNSLLADPEYGDIDSAA